MPFSHLLMPQVIPGMRNEPGMDLLDPVKPDSFSGPMVSNPERMFATFGGLPS